MKSLPGRLLLAWLCGVSGFGSSLQASLRDTLAVEQTAPLLCDSSAVLQVSARVDSLARGFAATQAVAVDSLPATPAADSLLSASKPDKQASRHSPTQAAWKAAVLPGWGQVYNRKYWKLPLVYGGLGALGTWVWFNADQHRFYRQAFEAKSDDNPDTPDPLPFVSEASVLSTKEFYRRQLDASILITVAFYGLQIVDAVVDAHLFEFDVSDDLALQWSPWLAVAQGPGMNSAAGLSINLKLRP
jgi:hypothetical protein